MLKKLAANAKLYKEIWGFLALVAGLGVSWGTLNTKVSAMSSRLTETRTELHRTNLALRESERHLHRTIEWRFDRAHDLLERRLQQNELALGEIHGSVERLAYVTGMANGHGGGTVASPAAKQVRVEIKTSLDRAQRQHPFLKHWDADVAQRPGPPDLPAF